MHEQNIETLRDEALRLTAMQLNILSQMLAAPGVIAESQAGQTQTFDRDSTPNFIEILEGEKTKLARLELVLAVVGTMKAGKSTTINAIVGTEVLPNRNRPMTALPTLIEHTPGQLEPILEFGNNAPIEKLIHQLNQAIKRPENKESIEDLAHNQDMQELLGLIEKKATFKKRYEGAQAIFWFLKSLNDLVRLSKELDISFPFSDYNKIHELPVIKVEFVHLREMNDTTGKLTLLDTPGPNESGQPHLRKMLKEQLEKASAVLAVLDFSQLKSDADAQVRDDLKDIADVAEKRLYALVNKFDQRDRNSDSEKETKAFVSNTLMEGKISEDLIFPVSSKFAYLANYAKRELVVHGKLPDHNAQPWVEDFGNAAFGQFWEESITDVDDVRKCADRLWKRSAFHAPLQNVIQSAHAQAALFAVEAASTTLVKMSEALNNFFNVRETALKKSTEELKNAINELQQEVSRINALEEDAKKQANNTLAELTGNTKKAFEAVEKHVLESIDKYFKKGKQEEADEYNKRLEKLKKEEEFRASNQNAIISIFLAFRPRKRVESKNHIVFDPNKPILTFSYKDEARHFILNIHRELDEIVRDNESAMKRMMNEALPKFQTYFSKSIIEDAKEVIKNTKARMNEDGFDINLAIPDLSLLSLKTSGADLLTDLMDEKTRSVTRHRRKDSLWGKICGWFDTDDWGWESYQTQEQFFEINIKKIEDSAKKDIKRIFSDLHKDIEVQIKEPLNQSIRDFFVEFRKTLEQIRGDLLQSMRDQERSKVEQEALVKRLTELKKTVPAINKDSAELKKDMQHKLHANTGLEA